MQIKYRITFIYTMLVMVLMVLLCASAYTAVWLNREDQIRKRLMNRAFTTAHRLFEVKEMDALLLQRIDRATALNLDRRYLAVYNEHNGVEYLYRDDPKDTVLVTPGLLEGARAKGGMYFCLADKKDAVAVYVTTDNNKYLIISAAYDAEGYAHLYNLRIIFLVSLVAATIITLITGYIFSKRMLSPINKMTSELNSITSGHFDKKLSTHKGKNELERLAATINDLLDRLKDSFDTQSRFISNASHELRTPLASISNALQVALQQERGNDAYRRVLTSVNEDVQYLNQLTNALLELAMASGTQQGLRLEEVRMDELLLEMPLLVKKLNWSYSIRLNMEELPDDENALVVYGNRDLLMTALKNMIGNACKFSDENKAIVTLGVDEGTVVITVENWGEVIPEDEHENIFMPFYRGKEAGKIAPGAGLGLSLSNRIIGLHNGSIELLSVGAHTSFKIILPGVEG